MNHLVLTSRPDAEISERWMEMLGGADMPTHYVTPDFFDDAFVGGGKRFAVLAENGGKFVAVLTGAVDGGRVASGFAVRPQTAFCRNVDRGRAFACLLDGINSIAGSEAELIDVHLWDRLVDLPKAFSERRAIGADQVVLLDLTKGSDALFADFSQHRRTHLRRFMRMNALTIKELETENERDELYEIHRSWTAGKGIEPDTFEAFSTLMGAKFRKTLVAIHHGRVVAGSYFRFCPGGVVEYAANNSLKEFQRFGPNEMLVWSAIQWACSNGFKTFSMGASHPFLLRFGGELVSTWRYRDDRTLLKVHANRERLRRIAVQTYNAMPDTIKNRLRQAKAA